MAVKDQSALRRQARDQDNDLDVGEIFSKRFGGVSIYVVCMLLLAAAIVWSGVKAAEQVQQYHQDYKILQDMRKQHRKLQIEHQRLLIEQQTFSATPQIASRAVAELGMYSPTTEDKLVLQPGAASLAVIPKTSSGGSVADQVSDGLASTDVSDDSEEAL